MIYIVPVRFLQHLDIKRRSDDTFSDEFFMTISPFHALKLSSSHGNSKAKECLAKNNDEIKSFNNKALEILMRIHDGRKALLKKKAEEDDASQKNDTVVSKAKKDVLDKACKYCGVQFVVSSLNIILYHLFFDYDYIVGVQGECIPPKKKTKEKECTHPVL